MNDKSRMNREVHVRFCERLEGWLLGPTRPSRSRSFLASLVTGQLQTAHASHFMRRLQLPLSSTLCHTKKTMKLVKSLVKFLFFTILGLGAYWFTFAVFYEAWFPDYRDSSPNLYFILGVFLILLVPVSFSIFQKLGSRDKQFWYLWVRSVVTVNLAAVAICVLTFAYMSTRVTFLGHGAGDSAVYELVPKGE